MTEQLQTRTEHSRNIEDAEKYKAIETLKSVGFLIPVSELATYHGRVAKDGEGEWSIDPSFQNGGNDSGNGNVNSRVTLYTSGYDVAQRFANARQAQMEYRDSNSEFIAQVHDIVSDDMDATVVDNSFRVDNLDDEAKKNYGAALRSLVLGVSTGVPSPFEERGVRSAFVDDFEQHNKTGFVSDEEIDSIAQRTGASRESIASIVGAVNTRIFMAQSPGHMINMMLRKSDINPSLSVQINEQQVTATFSTEYVESWLKNAHIIGIKQQIQSATLRGETIQSVSIFDLHKVKDRHSHDKWRKERQDRLGSLANRLADDEPRHDLMRYMSVAHAKPDKVIEQARKVPGFEKVFEHDAGNWEGYTLGEHTETVLRNFEENHADKVPVGMLATMRLAIVAHDIGKPIAVRAGEKHRQKYYNEMRAKMFFDELGIDGKTQGLVLAMIGRGSDLAFALDIQKKSSAAHDMTQLAKETMATYLDDEAPSVADMSGFIHMCRVLQVCDGGAYTSMAVTRDADKGYYRNAPSFDGSFKKPSGLGRRDIRMKE